MDQNLNSGQVHEEKVVHKESSNKLKSFRDKLPSDKKRLILLGLVVLAIPLTVTLALYQQEIRSRASGDVSGNATISAIAKGHRLSIRTTDRLAGAIDSLIWNDKEFVNSYDHGRQIQTAFSFDFLGECYNPTEAGGKYDGTGDNSHSKLRSISASGNKLITVSNPAYWLWPGTEYIHPFNNVRACNSQDTRYHTAKNTTVVSDYSFRKEVTIGYKGLDNVIEYKAKINTPRNHSHMHVEAVTGYMPINFSKFRLYDPSTHKEELLVDNSSLPREQNKPVIVSTPNDLYAMGVYSKYKTGVNLSINANIDPSYTIEYFPNGTGENRTSKWSCVYKLGDSNDWRNPAPNSVMAGTYYFTCFIIVGSLADVKESMDKLYVLENSLTSTPSLNPSPLPEPELPLGFLDSASCEVAKGWACDENNFQKALDIEFYADGPIGSGNLIGNTTASLSREDAVGNECGGIRNHGFNLLTPVSLKDGQMHKVYAYAKDDANPGSKGRLMGAPKDLICTAGTPVSPTPEPIGCIRNLPVINYGDLSKSGKRTEVLNYRIKIKNNDSSACPERKIAFDLDTPSNLTRWRYGPEYIKIAPGQTQAVDLWVKSGKYSAYGTKSLKLYIQRGYRPHTLLDTAIINYTVIK